MKIIMVSMDIDEIRRVNIKKLEQDLGTSLFKKLNMSPAQFYNLRDGAKDSKTGKPRGMRKETAWRIEDAAKKPRGWLSIDHSNDHELFQKKIDDRNLTDIEIELLKHFRKIDSEYKKLDVIDYVKFKASDNKSTGSSAADKVQAKNA